MTVASVIPSAEAPDEAIAQARKLDWQVQSGRHYAWPPSKKMRGHELQHRKGGIHVRGGGGTPDRGDGGFQYRWRPSAARLGGVQRWTATVEKQNRDAQQNPRRQQRLPRRANECESLQQIEHR